MKNNLATLRILLLLLASSGTSAHATIVTKQIYGTVKNVFAVNDTLLPAAPYEVGDLLQFAVTYDDESTTMLEGTDGDDDIAFTDDDVLWQNEASTYKSGQYDQLSNAVFSTGFESIFARMEASIQASYQLFDLSPGVSSHMQNRESNSTHPQFVYNGDHRSFITNDLGGRFGVRFRGGDATGLTGDELFVHFDVNAPGSIPENPLLPDNDLDGFEFSFPIDHPNQTMWIDPLVAIGYDYIVDSGPAIQSVVLPTGIGDGLFDLWTFDVALNDFVDSGIDLLGGDTYDFGAGGVERFRVLGIEVDAGLDPTDATAFVTGLNFVSGGTINMRQVPITFDTDSGSNGSVSVPATWFLLFGGMFSVGAFRGRKSKP